MHARVRSAWEVMDVRLHVFVCRFPRVFVCACMFVFSPLYVQMHESTWFCCYAFVSMQLKLSAHRIR